MSRNRLSSAIRLLVERARGRLYRQFAPLTPAYTPTNVTTDRAYDANSSSIDEVADVLGTLIADLKARGLVG